jgi:hypothetical protein
MLLQGFASLKHYDQLQNLHVTCMNSVKIDLGHLHNDGFKEVLQATITMFMLISALLEPDLAFSLDN